jgi:hypothetical protein
LSGTADLNARGLSAARFSPRFTARLKASQRAADNVTMPHLRRRTCLVAALLVCLVPAVAAAENSGLRVPTIAASAAAAADWASTYHALKNYKIRETNPLLRPFEQSPGQLVTVGALMDAGAITAWNLTVGKKKPRLAAAGLWAMAAFRAYLVVHNIRNTQKAAHR